MSIITRNPTSVKPFATRFVSINIEINDTRYSVDPIDPGECGSKAYRLTKRGGDRAVYDVIREHGSIVACDCPDYEARRRGNGYELCKHGRALVELGLMLAPIAPLRPIPDPVADAWVAAHPYTNELPAPCCPASEPAPCSACVTADEPAVTELAPVALFPADRLDPWDAESDPNLWSPDTDEDVWNPTETDPVPIGDDDHLWNAGEPSESDLADLGAWKNESAARDHLDHSERLTLAELADRQTDFYRSWGSATGAMFAAAMEALALKIRMTESTTPDELEARSDALDLAVRENWEAIGHDSALRQCQCQDR